MLSAYTSSKSPVFATAYRTVTAAASVRFSSAACTCFCEGASRPALKSVLSSAACRCNGAMLCGKPHARPFPAHERPGYLPCAAAAKRPSPAVPLRRILRRQKQKERYQKRCCLQDRAIFLQEARPRDVGGICKHCKPVRRDMRKCSEKRRKHGKRQKTTPEKEP